MSADQQDPAVTAAFARADLLLKYHRLADQARALVARQSEDTDLTEADHVQLEADIRAVETEGQSIWMILHPEDRSRVGAEEHTS